jgi:hypothetical protein
LPTSVTKAACPSAMLVVGVLVESTRISSKVGSETVTTGL